MVDATNDVEDGIQVTKEKDRIVGRFGSFHSVV
jgi:hypothetical protein